MYSALAFPKTLADTVVVDSNPTMSIISWIVLGLIAGFIASKLVNKTGEGIFLDIVLGIVGAVIGGFIVRALGIGGGVSGFNIPSLLVAVLGAVVFLVAYHALRGNLGKSRTS